MAPGASRLAGVAAAAAAGWRIQSGQMNGHDSVRSSGNNEERQLHCIVACLESIVVQYKSMILHLYTFENQSLFLVKYSQNCTLISLA